ncbi:CHASE2 domain-containing serine/threonine-protein kinase [Rhodoferax ferrireducens]|uniref:CHASE2 domain-containing serine/threonine-protein kinase n=1 Tax=Rhodoferax ferrireducens TaxID=192843 RepID=UPI001E3CCC64|nr:serine/threonine-protein kinase [Rhodoferax ferrireducens]
MFLGLSTLIAVIALHATTDLIGALERRFYDFASTSTSRQPSSQLAVIAIDAQSIASIGRWPWPPDIQARMIERLAAVKAKSIVYTDFVFEPESDRGLRFIRDIKTVLAVAAEAGSAPSVAHAQLTQLVAEAEVALDTDARLVRSFRSAANVVIPPSNSVAGQQTGEALPTAAAGVGPLNLVPDVDGVVRQVPLLLIDANKTPPSMALLAVATGLHLTAADIKLNPGASVQIGTLRVKTDSAGRMLPQFYKGRQGKPAFAVDSFDDVLTGKIPASRYADKIVVIGVTAAGVGTPFAVPGLPALSSAEAMAHITSSILNGHGFVQPVWALWVTLAALLLVGVYLMVLLPRLPSSAAATLTLLLLIALLGAEFGLLTGATLWLNMVLPTALLLIGHLAFMSKRVLLNKVDSAKSAETLAETDRMMGLALQGQGQLDMAFERFRRAPMGDALMGDLYALALDFERRRQFNTAEAVYQHMAAYNQDYKDLKSKLSPVVPLSEAVKTDLLGRYQVARELGKGAMGVVYLGKDPKIGRIVAIKTMALSEEFAGRALVDARERFFREAETAGRLQHQNIVTIFDAGEDHGLAYIAMEFLKGKDLTCFCTTEQLLPVPVVLSIVARVAEALGYAHGLHVVHRDIKPANIMFDLESDTVKVTDFGIARITDSSRTKTGLVLGTPSFMSPEQLAGKKVDGRSDLYSLGVTLFQLLTGVLPFRGDSMAELMQKIASDDAPDIRSIRPELPQNLASLVTRSLSKRPEARHQDGGQFASDLRAVLSGGTAIDLEI